jgi:hypothetical protein
MVRQVRKNECGCGNGHEFVSVSLLKVCVWKLSRSGVIRLQIVLADAQAWGVTSR